MSYVITINKYLFQANHANVIKKATKSSAKEQLEMFTKNNFLKSRSKLIINVNEDHDGPNKTMMDQTLRIIMLFMKTMMRQTLRIIIVLS